MKSAIVKYKNIPKSELQQGIIFEDISDIAFLSKELEKVQRSILVKFVKSGETVERLNHIVNGFRPLEKAVATLAICHNIAENVNPIYQLGNASDLYIKTLFKLLSKGAVFMNCNGGLCTLDGHIEVVSTESFDSFPNPPKYYIQKGSKVINLENDFELESEARDYMNKNFDRNYSYISDMKTYTDKDFKKVFSEFREQGGEVVYVYTTGIDYQQMYEYSRHCLDAGLKDFRFHFNSGIGKDIEDFINWLKERAEVTILQ